MTGHDVEQHRAATICSRLVRVRERIETACAAADRQPAQVQLIVVTKTWPVSDVLPLLGAGVGDVGENRDDEAAAKQAALATRCNAAGLPRWHMVGQVQSRKAASVARWADVVHSVDRTKLVDALQRGAERAGRRLGALVQVDLRSAAVGDPAPDAGRGGARPQDVLAIADRLAGSENLDLLGVMAVAPREEDPAAAFGRLATVAEALRQQHPRATWVSAGMSGDLEQAVAAGATHLRVGSAILGARPPAG